MKAEPEGRGQSGSGKAKEAGALGGGSEEERPPNLGRRSWWDPHEVPGDAGMPEPSSPQEIRWCRVAGSQGSSGAGPQCSPALRDSVPLPGTVQVTTKADVALAQRYLWPWTQAGSDGLHLWASVHSQGLEGRLRLSQPAAGQ